MKRTTLAIMVVLVGALLMAFGCANNSKTLLDQDYKKMNNEELLRYYYQLNDEIESQKKASGPSIGIGVGGGTGGKEYAASDLRSRRIDVRMEMQRRGLKP